LFNTLKTQNSPLSFAFFFDFFLYRTQVNRLIFKFVFIIIQGTFQNQTGKQHFHDLVCRAPFALQKQVIFGETKDSILSIKPIFKYFFKKLGWYKINLYFCVLLI